MVTTSMVMAGASDTFITGLEMLMVSTAVPNALVGEGRGALGHLEIVEAVDVGHRPCASIGDMTVAPTSGEPLASYNWPRTSRTVGL